MVSIGVTFVSVFLSLTTGLQPVEVMVSGPVARVEIRIDGETVGVLEKAPWRAECDFGPLRPLVLEAVAFDAERIERGRARQVVNLPRAAIESTIAIERNEEGLPHAARLITESAKGLEPISTRVTFDGKALEPTDWDRFTVPPYDPNEAHFLSARVDYAEGVVSHTEVSFGGPWAGETSIDLTAVPLLRPKRGKRLDVRDLEGCLLVGGREAIVVALEEPPAGLVIVTDLTAVEMMASIQKRRLGIGAYTDAPMGISPEQQIKDTWESMWNLRPSYPKLRMMSTSPRTGGSKRGGVTLFPLTSPAHLTRDAVMLLLSNPQMVLNTGGQQQVADAVAVAGLFVASTAAPRAVLLVLGSDPDRGSRDDPDNVRGYLESLNVPLFVWQTSANERSAEWGGSTRVTKAAEANKAMLRLLDYLERQSIVWLDGAHLPNQIELKPGVEGFEIAR
jgi:hypothetical protein